MIKSKAIHQAILATEKIFMAAYNRHDAPALSALYTTDAEIMPPNTKLVKGPKALRGLFKSFWDAGDVRIKLETVEADGSGEFGYEVGKYTLSYAPSDLHWGDIALAAPGMKPGEKRSLYRDPSGRLGDRP